MKSSPTLAVAALGLAAITALAGCSSSSSSNSSSSPSSTATALSMKDCTSQGKVWLVVQTDQDKTLANQCVGTPATGTAALEAANVSIGRSADGKMICTLGDYPNPCPTTFTGAYWQYYTATSNGSWTYSDKGADDSAPKAGSIEGWCYGASCTPKVDGVQAPSSSAASTDTSSATATSSASGA